MQAKPKYRPKSPAEWRIVELLDESPNQPWHDLAKRLNNEHLDCQPQLVRLVRMIYREGGVIRDDAHPPKPRPVIQSVSLPTLVRPSAPKPPVEAVKPRPFCNRCRSDGHWAAQCPERLPTAQELLEKVTPKPVEVVAPVVAVEPPPPVVELPVGVLLKKDADPSPPPKLAGKTRAKLLRLAKELAQVVKRNGFEEITLTVKGGKASWRVKRGQK